MKKLRAAVFRRAGNHCECGCGRFITPESGRWDHFFGRAKAPETMATTWALSIVCDNAKTANRPGAALWLRKFIEHAERHGYANEAEHAASKLAVLVAKGRAA